MSARLSVLTVGILMVATGAGAQSAGGAMRAILFRGEAGTSGVLSENSSAALYGLLLGETTTFPVGTSAGGFTWTFDDTLHVPVRRSRSFGPMFAERPFTTGKGKLNVGAALQHTTFSSVGGRALTDLEQSGTYGNGAQIFRRTSSLDVQLDRTIVSATYGLHDKIDIAAIVPFGSARVSGFAAYYERLNGVVATDVRTDRNGSSFGIGDILLRTKIVLVASDGFDAAAAVDIRLPTGDPEKLLGTGFTQTRLLFIGGTTVGSVNPHVNVGYTFGGQGMVFGADKEGSSGDPELITRQPSEEFNYTAGVDVAATARLTIAGDIIGRVVSHSAGMEFFDSGPGEDRTIGLKVTPGTVNKLLGAVGIKLSVGGAWLLTGTVLFPLNDHAIKPAVTPVIGFERAF